MMEMSEERLREIIREVLATEREIKQCPLDDIEAEKIAAFKAMPAGAFKMVCMTWGIVAGFGNWIGKGIALGLFVVVLAVLAIGGFTMLKLWGLFGGGN